jgi:hypothetical protein
MIRFLIASALLALAFGAATPAQAQGYALIGAWRCQSAQVVYDVVFNADGYYSGTYRAATGYRAYSEGPYRLTGGLLRIDYQIWETQPPTPNPGGETFSVLFRGGEAMALIPTRCPQGPECRFSCERHR